MHLAGVSGGEKIYSGSSIIIKIYPALSLAIGGRDGVDGSGGHWMTSSNYRTHHQSWLSGCFLAVGVRGTPKPTAAPRRSAEPNHRPSRPDTHQRQPTAPPCRTLYRWTPEAPPMPNRHCPSHPLDDRLASPTRRTDLYIPPHYRTLKR